jgi:hypothetical protein
MPAKTDCSAVCMNNDYITGLVHLRNLSYAYPNFLDIHEEKSSSYITMLCDNKHHKCRSLIIISHPQYPLFAMTQIVQSTIHYVIIANLS